MTIMLNHTIVPARNKEAAARQFAEIFGLPCGEVGEHFAPVKVNDTLTFLFDDAPELESHHTPSTSLTLISMPFSGG